MDLWLRDSDKRYFYVGMTRDLFGLVVVIAHGGRHLGPRVRTVPVWDTADGERDRRSLQRLLDALQHGFQPAPRRDAPDSDCSVYVTSLDHPRARAACQHRAYRNEQAPFGASSSTHTRVTSAVCPSSRGRATGRPTIATPTIRSPSLAATAYSPPCGALLWRWKLLTNSRASEIEMGIALKLTPPP